MSQFLYVILSALKILVILRAWDLLMIVLRFIKLECRKSSAQPGSRTVVYLAEEHSPLPLLVSLARRLTVVSSGVIALVPIVTLVLQLLGVVDQRGAAGVRAFRG